MKKFSKTYSDHSYISATRPTFITYPLITMIQIWRAWNWGRLISSPRCPSEHFTLVTSSHKELFAYKYNSIPRRLFWSTNMDAVSLFWSTLYGRDDVMWNLMCYEVGRKRTVFISLLCVVFPNIVTKRRLLSNYFETLLYFTLFTKATLSITYITYSPSISVLKKMWTTLASVIRTRHEI